MKNKILKADLKGMRNREHLQFIKLIAAALDENDPEQLNILMLFDELAPLIEEEEMTMSVEQGSSLTALRDAADVKRDKLHSALYNYVKSFTLDEDDTECCEAAQRVMRIIRQVGNPWKLSDQAETSMIVELGNALVPYEEDVKLIHGMFRVDRLLAANDRFADLDKRCREDKANRPPRNVKAVRQKINPIYLSIVDAINADVDRYRDGRLTPVIIAMNAIIKDYNAIIAHRKSQSGNKGGEQPEISVEIDK